MSERRQRVDDFETIRSSIRASIRRQSVQTTDSNILDSDKSHENVDFHNVYPRSLLSHSLRSNIDGVISAAPSLLMIASANFLMNKLNSLGGAFVDLHAVRCGVCVIGVEITAGW